MTIAVAIRTKSAVVFAADSKVTTRGFVGFEKNGKPRWMDQTYDNAVKVVRDGNGSLMAMVAGSASIGDMPATDFLTQYYVGIHTDRAAQDNAVSNLVSQMVARKQAYWTTTPITADQWPGPTILLASPGFDNINPRVWLIELSGATSTQQEILTSPGVYLEGSYLDTYALLYGFHFEVLTGIAKQARIRRPNRLIQAGISPQGFLRPTDKIVFSGMPLQDAIDFAVFLADVQVQMDRFLPGLPRCGGPIDVMVLVMSPREFISYPGKTLHHPRVSS